MCKAEEAGKQNLILLLDGAPAPANRAPSVVPGHPLPGQWEEPRAGPRARVVVERRQRCRAFRRLFWAMISVSLEQGGCLERWAEERQMGNGVCGEEARSVATVA